MSLSTLFSSAKVANYVGYLIVISPTLIFLQFVNITTNGKYLIYIFFFIPQMPTSCLLAQLATSQDLNKTLPFVVVDLDWISTPVCWVAIMLAVPMWLAIYIYLDQVMPNTYGVQKHPCFCLKRRRDRDAVVAENGIEDGKIYDSSDPVLISNLTKRFGSFTAVN